MSGRILSAALLGAAAIIAVACTTSGSGVGSDRKTGEQVTFNWQSSDSVSGNMSASFSDGRTFSGKYFQITTNTQVDTLGPLWDGWYRPWRGWPYWYGTPGPQFVTHYSGRVLANLASPNGEHMRCRFHLVHPQSGMAGGGQGACQFGAGNTIDATFAGRG